MACMWLVGLSVTRARREDFSSLWLFSQYIYVCVTSFSIVVKSFTIFYSLNLLHKSYGQMYIYLQFSYFLVLSLYKLYSYLMKTYYNKREIGNLACM